MNETKEKRIVALDCIRFFAILCVVLTHVTESIYTLNIDFLCSAERIVRVSGIMFFTIGRLGVPLFFFLTGYLMLDRTYTSEDIVKLWKRNVLGMFVATEIWICIYYLFSMWINHLSFSGELLIRQMLFLKNASCPHLWYMPVILGLYIFIPFVSNAINKCDRKIVCYPLIFVVLYLFVPPILNVFCYIFGKEPLYKIVDFSFSGKEYGVLLMIGWMIKQGFFLRMKNYFHIILFGWGYISTVVLELYAYKNGVEYNVWYDSLTLLIASFSMFNLCLNIKEVKIDALLGWLSRMAFAVYLCHDIVIVLLSKYLVITNYVTKTCIVFGGGLVISFCIVRVICFSKRISRVLFFVK